MRGKRALQRILGRGGGGGGDFWGEFRSVVPENNQTFEFAFCFRVRVRFLCGNAFCFVRSTIELYHDYWRAMFGPTCLGFSPVSVRVLSRIFFSMLSQAGETNVRFFRSDSSTSYIVCNGMLMMGITCRA